MAIKIENLTKTYDKDVLKKLNLHIKKGSIFGLLGVNGAGKTTLISILNFLVKKSSGDIKVFDKEFEKNISYVKSISSMVPQNYAFYPNLSGYENLEFFGALYGLKGKDLKQKIIEVIEFYSLQEVINKKAKFYSGGYKRRLNLAIGVLNNPSILYLDEPTAGVDPRSRKEILESIKKINKSQNITIIYTSHYMEEIEYICDDIAVLDKGEIVLHQKKNELLSKHSSLERLFLELTKEEIIA